MRSSLSAAVLCASATLPARAQPALASRPLRIIVATPAGGASDTAARLVAESLTKSLGQQVLVENKPGGNGVLAVQAVLSAPADGHTLLWAMSSMAGMPLLVKSAPVKSMSEFTPVVLVVNLMYGLLVNTKVPANTVGEFSAYLKANPDRTSYATGALSEYMVTAHYLRSAGLKALRVPYKGGAQLMPDLITGEVQFNFGPLAPALPHVRSGRLRLLATLPDRHEIVAGVPSLAAAGVATDMLPTWNGLVAPPGTPREVVSRIAQDVNRALADPAVRSALEAQGFRVTGGTPQQMGEAIELASATWRQFVRDYDIPQE
jgi:tripartite-type tricarboxylate transporter receptor subunit TctC